MMIDNSEEVSSYEFRLLITKVFLTVKFHCKMHLRYDQEKISDEVPMAQPSQFIFQQEVILKDTALKGVFEIGAHLTTDKGNHIVAGMIKFENNDLVGAQGQTITIPMSNCLDSQAKCEMKVIRVRNIRVRKQNNRFRAASGLSSIRGGSSQDFDYFGHRSNITLKDKQKNYKESQRLLSDSRSGFNYRQSRVNPLSRQPSLRKKSDYSREKYKIQFQTLENNLKLDIAKSKLRIDELQRLNEQKLRMIKNLNEQLNNIKIKEYHQIYYNQEIQNKNKMLETYEGYLKELRKQNQDLRNRKMDLQKNLMNAQQTSKFDIQKLQNDLQKDRAMYLKEKEKAREDLQYLQFQLESKNQKLEKMKFMIEDYELKVSSVEEDYKILLKSQRDENRRKYQLVSNQLKCLESAFRIEEMTWGELEKENKVLKSRLKDKQSQILLIFQQINILKSEASNKDEFKVKYAEMHRSKGMADLTVLDLTDKNKRLKEKQYELQSNLKRVEEQMSSLRKELKSQKDKNNQMSKQIEDLSVKIGDIESGTNKNQKVFKTFEWEIKYIQDNQKDWREIMKSKNQKILQLTEQIQQNRREYSQEQLRNIKLLQNKDSEVAKLVSRIKQLESEFRVNRLRVNSTKREEEMIPEWKPSTLSMATEAINQNVSGKREKELQRHELAEEILKKQIILRDNRIKRYEDYIERYINNEISSTQNINFYQVQISDLEKEIMKKDEIIESLNELIYEKDKESSVLKEKSELKTKQIEREDHQEIQSYTQEIEKKERIIWDLNGKVQNLEQTVQYYRNSNKELGKLIESISVSMAKVKENEVKEDIKKIKNKMEDIENRLSDRTYLNRGLQIRETGQEDIIEVNREPSYPKPQRLDDENNVQKDRFQSNSLKKQLKNTLDELRKTKDQLRVAKQDLRITSMKQENSEKTKRESNDERKWAAHKQIKEKTDKFQIKRSYQYVYQSLEASGVAKHLKMSKQRKNNQQQLRNSPQNLKQFNLNQSSKDFISLDNSNFDLVDKLHEKDEIIGLLKHENMTFKQDRDHARHRIDELEREIIKIKAINPGANVTKSSREEMIKTPIGLVSQTQMIEKETNYKFLSSQAQNKRLAVENQKYKTTISLLERNLEKQIQNNEKTKQNLSVISDSLMELKRQKQEKKNTLVIQNLLEKINNLKRLNEGKRIRQSSQIRLDDERKKLEEERKKTYQNKKQPDYERNNSDENVKGSSKELQFQIKKVRQKLKLKEEYIDKLNSQIYDLQSQLLNNQKKEHSSHNGDYKHKPEEDTQKQPTPLNDFQSGKELEKYRQKEVPDKRKEFNEKKRSQIIKKEQQKKKSSNWNINMIDENNMQANKQKSKEDYSKEQLQRSKLGQNIIRGIQRKHNNQAEDKQQDRSVSQQSQQERQWLSNLLMERQQEIQQLEGKIKNLEEAQLSLQNQVQKATAQKEGFKDKLKGYEALSSKEEAELVNTITNLQRQIREKNKQLSENDLKVFQIQAKLNSLEVDLKDKQDGCNQYQQEIQILQDEIFWLREQIRDHDQINSILESSGQKKLKELKKVHALENKPQDISPLTKVADKDENKIIKENQRKVKTEINVQTDHRRSMNSETQTEGFDLQKQFKNRQLQMIKSSYDEKVDDPEASFYKRKWKESQTQIDLLKEELSKNIKIDTNALLKDSNRDFQSQLALLQRQNDKIKSELLSLKTQKDNDQIKKQESSMGKPIKETDHYLKNQKDVLEEQKSSSEFLEKINSLQEDVKRQKLKNTDLTKKLSISMNNEAESREIIQQFQQKIRRNESNETANDEKVKMQAKIKHIEDEYTKMTVQNQLNKKKLNELENVLKKDSKTNENIRQSMNCSVESVSNYKFQPGQQDLKKENNQMMETIKELQEKLLKKENEIKDIIRHQNIEQSDKISNLINKNQDLCSQLETKDKELNQISQTDKQKQNSIEELLQKIISKNRQIEMLEGQIQQLGKAEVQLKEKCVKQQTECKTLMNKMKAYQIFQNNSQSELLNKIAELQMKNQNKDVLIAESNKQLMEMQAELNQTATFLQQIKGEKQKLNQHFKTLERPEVLKKVNNQQKTKIVEGYQDFSNIKISINAADPGKKKKDLEEEKKEGETIQYYSSQNQSEEGSQPEFKRKMKMYEQELEAYQQQNNLLKQQLEFFKQQVEISKKENIIKKIRFQPREVDKEEKIVVQKEKDQDYEIKQRKVGKMDFESSFQKDQSHPEQIQMIAELKETLIREKQKNNNLSTELKKLKEEFIPKIQASRSRSIDISQSLDHQILSSRSKDVEKSLDISKDSVKMARSPLEQENNRLKEQLEFQQMNIQNLKRQIARISDQNHQNQKGNDYGVVEEKELPIYKGNNDRSQSQKMISRQSSNISFAKRDSSQQMDRHFIGDRRNMKINKDERIVSVGDNMEAETQTDRKYLERIGRTESERQKTSFLKQSSERVSNKRENSEHQSSQEDRQWLENLIMEQQQQKQRLSLEIARLLKSQEELKKQKLTLTNRNNQLTAKNEVFNNLSNRQETDLLNEITRLSAQRKNQNKAIAEYDFQLFQRGNVINQLRGELQEHIENNNNFQREINKLQYQNKILQQKLKNSNEKNEKMSQKIKQQTEFIFNSKAKPLEQRKKSLQRRDDESSERSQQIVQRRQSILKGTGEQPSSALSISPEKKREEISSLSQKVQNSLQIRELCIENKALKQENIEIRDKKQFLERNLEKNKNSLELPQSGMLKIESSKQSMTEFQKLQKISELEAQVKSQKERSKQLEQQLSSLMEQKPSRRNISYCQSIDEELLAKDHQEIQKYKTKLYELDHKIFNLQEEVKTQTFEYDKALMKIGLLEKTLRNQIAEKMRMKSLVGDLIKSLQALEKSQSEDEKERIIKKLLGQIRELQKKLESESKTIEEILKKKGDSSDEGENLELQVIKLKRQLKIKNQMIQDLQQQLHKRNIVENQNNHIKNMKIDPQIKSNQDKNRKIMNNKMKKSEICQQQHKFESDSLNSSSLSEDSLKMIQGQKKRPQFKPHEEKSKKHEIIDIQPLLLPSHSKEDSFKKKVNRQKSGQLENSHSHEDIEEISRKMNILQEQLIKKDASLQQLSRELQNLLNKSEDQTKIIKKLTLENQKQKNKLELYAKVQNYSNQQMIKDLAKMSSNIEDKNSEIGSISQREMILTKQLKDANEVIQRMQRQLKNVENSLHEIEKEEVKSRHIKIEDRVIEISQNSVQGSIGNLSEERQSVSFESKEKNSSKPNQKLSNKSKIRKKQNSLSSQDHEIVQERKSSENNKEISRKKSDKDVRSEKNQKRDTSEEKAEDKLKRQIENYQIKSRENNRETKRLLGELSKEVDSNSIRNKICQKEDVSSSAQQSQSIEMSNVQPFQKQLTKLKADLETEKRKNALLLMHLNLFSRKNMKGNEEKGQMIISQNKEQVESSIIKENSNLAEVVRELQNKTLILDRENAQLSFQLDKYRMRNNILEQALEKEIEEKMKVKEDIQNLLETFEKNKDLDGLMDKSSIFELNNQIKKLEKELKQNHLIQIEKKEERISSGSSKGRSERLKSKQEMHKKDIKIAQLEKQLADIKKKQQDPLIVFGEDETLHNILKKGEQIDYKFIQDIVDKANNSDHSKEDKCKNLLNDKQRYVKELSERFISLKKAEEQLKNRIKELNLENKKAETRQNVYKKLSVSSEAELVDKIVSIEADNAQKEKLLDEYDLNLFKTEAQLNRITSQLEQMTDKNQKLEELFEKNQQKCEKLQFELKKAEIQIKHLRNSVEQAEMLKKIIKKAEGDKLKIDEQYQYQLEQQEKENEKLKVKIEQERSRIKLLEKQFDQVDLQRRQLKEEIDQKIKNSTLKQQILTLKQKDTENQNTIQKLRQQLSKDNKLLIQSEKQRKRLLLNQSYRQLSNSTDGKQEPQNIAKQFKEQSGNEIRQQNRYIFKQNSTLKKDDEYQLKQRDLSESVSEENIKNTLLRVELNELKATLISESEKNNQLKRLMEESLKENEKLRKIMEEIGVLLLSLKPLASNYKKSQDFAHIEAKIREINIQLQKNSKRLKVDGPIQAISSKNGNKEREEKIQYRIESKSADIEDKEFKSEQIDKLRSQYGQLREKLVEMQKAKDAILTYQDENKAIRNEIENKQNQIKKIKDKLAFYVNQNELLKTCRLKIDEDKVPDQSHMKMQQHSNLQKIQINRQKQFEAHEEPEEQKDEEKMEYVSVVPRLFVKKREQIEFQDLHSSQQRQKKQTQKKQTQKLDVQRFDHFLTLFGEIRDIIELKSNKVKNSSEFTQILIFRDDLSLDRVLRWINQFIRDLKEKYSLKCTQCNEYITLMGEQFSIKNEYKSLNRQLIKEKAELGMSEAQQIGKLFDLQAQNTRLKIQLKEIMEDYHGRIEIITKLKNNLSFLNISIQNSQEQTQDLKSKSEKYQEKIKIKQKELKNKENEINALQNRYKEILNFYTNQLEKVNREVEAERRKNIDDRDSLQEQVRQLRSKNNQLTFQNEKLIKSFDLYKEEIEIEKMNASHLYENVLNGSVERDQIQQRLRAIQDQRKMMESEIQTRDDKIVQLIEDKERLEAEMSDLKQRHQRELEGLAKENELKKIDTTRKIVQLQSMLADLSVATQKVATKRHQGQMLKIHSEQSLPEQGQKKNSQHLTGKEVKLLEIIQKQCNDKSGRLKEQKKPVDQAASPKARQVGVIHTRQKVDKMVFGSLSPKTIMSPKRSFRPDDKAEISKVRSTQRKY